MIRCWLTSVRLRNEMPSSIAAAAAAAAAERRARSRERELRARMRECFSCVKMTCHYSRAFGKINSSLMLIFWRAYCMYRIVRALCPMQADLFINLFLLLKSFLPVSLTQDKVESSPCTFHPFFLFILILSHYFTAPSHQPETKLRRKWAGINYQFGS